MAEDDTSRSLASLALGLGALGLSLRSGFLARHGGGLGSWGTYGDDTGQGLCTLRRSSYGTSLCGAGAGCGWGSLRSLRGGGRCALCRSHFLRVILRLALAGLSYSREGLLALSFLLAGKLLCLAGASTLTLGSLRSALLCGSGEEVESGCLRGRGLCCFLAGFLALGLLVVSFLAGAPRLTLLALGLS